MLRDPEGGIAALLNAMDGRKTLRELSEAHEIQGPVGELIAYLFAAGSIAAAEELWRPFHTTTENPQHFGSVMRGEEVLAHTRRHTWTSVPVAPAPPGSLLELASRRRTCRSFAPNSLSLVEVRDVLASAYSAATRATPSAGGLYSCRIDLLHRSEADQVWHLYSWDPIEAKATLGATRALDSGELQHALDSVSILHGAAAIAVISADPTVHSTKYSNRGYRYSILEAGHVAQMIHLAATERDLGALEWGAFNDRALARVVRSKTFQPVTVVGLGRPSIDREPVGEPNRASLGSSSFSAFGDPLGEGDGGSGVVIAQIPLTTVGGLPTGDYATGVHWAGSLAGVKARSEFVERQACGSLQIDEVGSADVLRARYHVFDAGALFPGDLPGFATEPNEFESFDASDGTYQWRVGTSETGAVAIVPVELVYFPVRSKDIGRPLCGTTTSSGVAAHISIEEARKSALLELIERDAFVRHWIARQPPALVAPPEGLFDAKLAHLKSSGIEVSFGQLDAAVPAIYCAMISADGAHLAFGLAANTLVNAAVEKAFLDAYGTYLTAHRTSNLGSGAHLSHYVAYQDAESISRIGWFFNGRESTLNPDVNEIAFKGLRSTTFYVSLDSRADADLVVVRALNSSLRPIWFGSRWQPSDDPNDTPHFFS